METKHTPGPWAENWSTRTNNEPCKGWFVEAESAYDRDTYGAIANLPDGRENTEANARLIAAAPELLEACKALMQLDPPCPFHPPHGEHIDARYAEWFSMWEKVVIAISKAEGNS